MVPRIRQPRVISALLISALRSPEILRRLAMAVILVPVSGAAQNDVLLEGLGMRVLRSGGGCAATVSVEVHSTDPRDFDGERRNLEDLVNNARAALGIECLGVSIRRVVITGKVRGELYFAGATDAGWGWALKGLFAAPRRT